MFNSALAFTERLLPPLLPFFSPSFLCSSASSGRAVVFFFFIFFFSCFERGDISGSGASRGLITGCLFFSFFFSAYVCRLFQRTTLSARTLAQTSKMRARAWPQTPHYCRGQLCAARRSAHACSAFGTGEVAVLIPLFGAEPTIVAAPLAKSTTLAPLLTITASYFPEL